MNEDGEKSVKCFFVVQQCYDTWNFSNRNRSKRTKEAKRVRFFVPGAPRLFPT